MSRSTRRIVPKAVPSGRRPDPLASALTARQPPVPLAPPPRPTRKSTRASKANQKVEGDANVEVDKLFEMLAQEFHAIGRTCEKIAEEINKNA